MQDWTKLQIICLPDSVNAPTKMIMVREGPLEGNELEASNNEELADLDEGWTMVKSMGAQ